MRIGYTQISTTNEPGWVFGANRLDVDGLKERNELPSNAAAPSPKRVICVLCLTVPD